VRLRKVIDATFVTLVVVFGAYGILDAFFPRLHNERKCDNDEPRNRAELTALNDARARAAAVCEAPYKRCLFWIDDGSYRPDHRLRISAVGFKSDLFEGCIHLDYLTVVYVYDQNAKLVATEEAPYG